MAFDLVASVSTAVSSVVRFFEDGFLEEDFLAAGFVAVLRAVVFRGAVCFADADFAAGFFAAGFFAAGFLAAGFLAAGFLAAGFLAAVLAAVVLAPVVFFADVELAATVRFRVSSVAASVLAELARLDFVWEVDLLDVDLLDVDLARDAVLLSLAAVFVPAFFDAMRAFSMRPTLPQLRLARPPAALAIRGFLLVLKTTTCSRFLEDRNQFVEIGG
ncbi:MAG: hypothetical protein ACPW61_06830 [Methyloligella sp. ZOD6]